MRLLKRRGRWFFPLVLISFLSASAGLLLYSASSRAAHCTPGSATPCVEDIANTKHNLSDNQDINAGGTTEVCVFCHTPHGANDSAPGSAPLWNRPVPEGPGLTPADIDALPGSAPAGTFTIYDSPNFDATPGKPQGVSLACLSCHDGTIAVDALINAPGSGGFFPNNRGEQNLGPGTSLSKETNSPFTLGGTGGSGILDGGNNTFDDLDRDATVFTGDTEQGFKGGLDDLVGGAGGAAPFPNLTRFLADDHPISMEMPTGTLDPQFANVTFNETFGNIAGVKRGTRALPPDRRDWVRLYTAPGQSGNARYVECASCHNPHTPRTTFLRLPSIEGGAGDGNSSVVTGATRNLNHEPNQGSLICLTCHEK